MSADGPRPLRLAGAGDPVDELWLALPAEWRGPVIGPGIADWERFSESDGRRLDLTGLPVRIARELAWMARWQAMDGTRSSVLAMNQLASILRRAIAEQHPFPGSILDMDWDTAAGLQGWFYAVRWRRLPPREGSDRLRVVFRFARLALIARCDGRPWWALDDWHPRCDPRIPLSGREPQANYGCSPGQISQPWLRDAVKWYLGTMLESGALRWTTVSQERLKCLARFSPTPRTLGVSCFLGFRVLVFRVCPGVCFLFACGHGCCPRVAAGLARGSTVRGPAYAGRSSFLTGQVRAAG